MAPWLSCHRHACLQESWAFWRKVKSKYEDPGHTLLHPGVPVLLQPQHIARRWKNSLQRTECWERNLCKLLMYRREGSLAPSDGVAAAGRCWVLHWQLDGQVLGSGKLCYLSHPLSKMTDWLLHSKPQIANCTLLVLATLTGVLTTACSMSQWTLPTGTTRIST